MHAHTRWFFTCGALIAVVFAFTVPAHAQTFDENAVAVEEAVDAAEEAMKEERGAVGSAVDAGKEVVSTTVDTGRDVVKGVGEATTEVGGALAGGGEQVVDQTRAIWQEALLPSLQRTAAAIPVVVKALLLLLAFWIVARLLGAATTKLLGLTNLDNKLVSQLGLGDTLAVPGAPKRSIEKLAGSIIKWIILLLGFVAFFNALNLQMVADPLQNVVDRVMGVVPNLLKAFAILFAYWAVATLIKLGLTKALGAASFDERAVKYFPARVVKGETLGPSAQIGRLFFYVILLFGIPPFLAALGQEALVSPLQEMLGEVLSFLPNIVAAGIILLVGNIVATIVREVVTNFLAAAGADAGAEKLGFGRVVGDKKLSGVIGLVAYFFIIVPVIVSAVDSLQITAISDPVKTTLESVLSAIPLLLVACVIIGIGYAVAKFVRNLVETFLSGVGFDALPDKLGLPFLKPGGGRATLSSVAGAIVMVVILILTAQQALATLGFEQLSGLVDAIVRYLPSLVSGLVILFVALSLANYVSNLVNQATAGSGHAKVLTAVAKYAIIFLGASMALDQLGVGEQIVTAAVTAVLGGTALALGLAFGLGGKDRAREIIEKSG